ncbi:glycosyltransferase family 4 protein [Seonamhaeicola algicola]|uniref:Glycosyltransferase family 4 protein n=1 Tax=Seonamhaeicola algicola TaxID=1719036 RepID=A0A5C7AWH1_9FLAO|nr:glycosyltransferase family 4 protein [Seonamhaeicola algicola]TXE12043.1 glycosyltransferase family 4 protein [Seonamhaeicola algicola]
MKQKPLNIAIFTPSQNPYSETFIQAHKKYLKGRVFYYYGMGSHIQLEGGGRLMPVSLYKLYRIYEKLFKKGKAYLWHKRLLYSLKKNKIDVVLVEYGTHAYHLYNVLKTSKLPTVVHFHGYDASIKSIIESCNYYKEVFSFSKAIITVSNVMYRALLDMGCPKDKLISNVYGPQEVFESIIPTYRKKQFLAVGRFTDKKAPYYTIMAFNKVLKKHPDAILLMAGDGALLNTCKNLVNYLNIAQDVTFLGVITPETYSDLLRESLAFVQHSVTASNGDMEGTPLAVLEASVAGLPVISTYHAGIPDIIKHGETGLLSDEHDVETMANHMCKVLDDLDYVKQLGNAGKIYIKTHFSLQRHIDRLQEILEN